MYPHERSLVERLANKPFAILGVNSDADRETIAAVVKKKNLTWRSWWDGGSTTGPISTLYAVNAWPTIYLIDHNGIIRHKDLQGDALDAAIAALVAEAEKS